jgi:hypothetical protein
MRKKDNKRVPKKKNDGNKRDDNKNVSGGKNWTEIKGKRFQIGALITIFNSGTKFNGILGKVSKKYVEIFLTNKKTTIALKKEKITEIY